MILVNFHWAVFNSSLGSEKVGPQARSESNIIAAKVRGDGRSRYFESVTNAVVQFETKVLVFLENKVHVCVKVGEVGFSWPLVGT